MSERLEAPLVRDWQGARRAYCRVETGVVSPSLRALAQLPLRLDPRGVLDAWGLAKEPGRTVLLDVRKLPCADLPALVPTEPWAAVFEADVARIARRVRAPVLALGGGLDAAAVLTAWRATGLPLPAVMTLETGLESYDEVDEAVVVAASLGAVCEVVSISPLQLVDLLPAAVASAESPLYNLHPLSRLALVRAAAERGYRTLVTGDGADALFTHRPDHDYVPIVAALTEASGMTLESPFFQPHTLAATLAASVDPEKRALREYVTPAGLPPWVTHGPKRARWMPALDVSRFLDRPLLDRLAAELDLPVRIDSDRDRVGWATLGLLVRALQGHG